MNGPDYPQDDKPGTTNNVPGLIHDYRAQRDAWREQARNLARMREEVLSAADREARGIVTAARADVRRILLKARRDLLVLAAQVRAAGRLGEPEDTPETLNFLPADDLGQVDESLISARQDVRRVLDESRPELEGLAAEGEALRAALRPQRANAAAEFPRYAPRTVASLPETTTERYQAPVDFEFTSIATDDFEEPFVRAGLRYSLRTFVVAAASVGALAVMGIAWWVFRSPAENLPTSTAAASAPLDRRATTSVSKLSGTADATPARSRPAADARTAGTLVSIAASQSAWVRVTVDGRVAVERTFRAGETQQVRAAREVSVRAGDAGAVTVSVDGRQPVSLGREGEVVTRRFGIELPRAQTAPPAAARPNSSVPVANAIQQRPPIAPAAPPTTAAMLPNPAPRVVEQAPPPPVSTPAPVVPLAAATAGARPTNTAIERPATPSAPVAASAATLQDSLASQASRWLDAHYRQDRASMAAISGAQVSVTDDRAEKERLPAGLAGVRRSLDESRMQVFGPEAMLTAKMTERVDDATAGRMAVSFVSLMWSQRNGVWQLHDVRIVSASSLNRAVPR
jgi:hypothetical protein